MSIYITDGVVVNNPDNLVPTQTNGPGFKSCSMYVQTLVLCQKQ